MRQLGLVSMLLVLLMSGCAKQQDYTFYDKIFMLEQFADTNKCTVANLCYRNGVSVHRVYLYTYVLESNNHEERLILNTKEESVQLTIDHDTKFFSWDKGRIFKGDWDVVENLVDQVVYAK